ncbi:hypothetical protein B0A54_08212 [Friedmanniomyces endolithicus]|uniref:Urea active transporter n=1 Tax=Friedmanniomyces endolithicus TaxID=329885 RepID=A0A4U0V268_9PEZI|nr:hypothetical protein B0A54_08212 [Friedmanniomyces endolithicus]
MLVGACLVLGGSQVVAALTGMSVYAACFLIPIVVGAYVIAGGLRSTFIADYVHTVVLFVAIFVFGFLMYATSDLVGSPGRLYELLLEASRTMPIPGNVDESYLSFRSVDGLVFAIDLFAAGFSTVWLDQAYWQRAIASKPETSVRAYLLGGVAWYVSSLLTFDVYKTYIKPDAPSSQLVRISHYGIILYALVLAAFCSILNAVGLNLTWLLTILAIIVGGASIPVGLILLWKRMSTVAAVASPWIGLVCGLIAWFVTTWKRSGSITVTTSGNTINAVAGNVTSWGVGLIMAVVLSLAFPAKYSSTDARHIARSNKIQGISVHPSATGTPAEASGTPNSPADKDGEKPTSSPATEEPRPAPEPEAPIPTGNEIVDFLEAQTMQPMDPAEVAKAERLAIAANLVFFCFAIILVPFTLFGTRYIYGPRFFTGWVVVSFLWVWTSMTICVIYPVVESTGALGEVARGLWGDLRVLVGGRKGRVGEEGEGSA